jgi:hypothetical protein
MDESGEQRLNSRAWTVMMRVVMRGCLFGCLSTRIKTVRQPFFVDSGADAGEIGAAHA